MKGDYVFIDFDKAFSCCTRSIKDRHDLSPATGFCVPDNYCYEGTPKKCSIVENVVVPYVFDELDWNPPQ